jgi:hypothetical protein
MRCAGSPWGAPDTLQVSNADADASIVSVTTRSATAESSFGMRRPRLVAQQPSNVLVGKASLPAPDADLGLTCLAHDVLVPTPSAVSKIQARQTGF